MNKIDYIIIIICKLSFLMPTILPICGYYINMLISTIAKKTENIGTTEILAKKSFEQDVVRKQILVTCYPLLTTSIFTLVTTWRSGRGIGTADFALFSLQIALFFLLFFFYNSGKELLLPFYNNDENDESTHVYFKIEFYFLLIVSILVIVSSFLVDVIIMN